MDKLTDEERRSDEELAPLAHVLAMTGCKDAAELQDMANIGRSFMESLDQLVKLDGPFKDWSPAEDPAELVFDMLNALDEARASKPQAPDREGVEDLLEEVIFRFDEDISSGPLSKALADALMSWFAFASLPTEEEVARAVDPWAWETRDRQHEAANRLLVKLAISEADFGEARKGADTYTAPSLTKARTIRAMFTGGGE